MTQLNERLVETGRHCAYCGHNIENAGPVIESFGERLCSEAHAEEFTAGVRAARIKAAARAEPAAASECGLPPAGQRTWKDSLKRSACWGAPLLLLLAIPLFWSGGAVATAGGSLLSVLALLACPLGMYFMMRTMGNMSHGTHGTKEASSEGQGTSRSNPRTG
ncbi:MAG: DUF2933 domain-containing protein [Candidatus Rokubacteria bacterium]|nr:DUF2933 domain-containing protein [Candidatus Rokubacteria bacterium]